MVVSLLLVFFTEKMLKVLYETEDETFLSDNLMLVLFFVRFVLSLFMFGISRQVFACANATMTTTKLSDEMGNLIHQYNKLKAPVIKTNCSDNENQEYDNEDDDEEIDEEDEDTSYDDINYDIQNSSIYGTSAMEMGIY